MVGEPHVGRLGRGALEPPRVLTGLAPQAAPVGVPSAPARELRGGYAASPQDGTDHPVLDSQDVEGSPSSMDLARRNPLFQSSKAQSIPTHCLPSSRLWART